MFPHFFILLYCRFVANLGYTTNNGKKTERASGAESTEPAPDALSLVQSTKMLISAQRLDLPRDLHHMSLLFFLELFENNAGFLEFRTLHQFRIK